MILVKPTYTFEDIAAMSAGERASALKRELGVLSTLRKQVPMLRRELDDMTFGDLILSLHRWIDVSRAEKHLINQYSVVAMLLQVAQNTPANASRPLPELVQLARAEVSRVKQSEKLQAEGAPAEWAEMWVDRGS
jgi:hypothetical protein